VSLAQESLTRAATVEAAAAAAEAAEDQQTVLTPVFYTSLDALQSALMAISYPFILLR
jgi:hypothetical protein